VAGGAEIYYLPKKQQKSYYFPQKSRKNAILTSYGGGKGQGPSLALPSGRLWIRIFKIFTMDIEHSLYIYFIVFSS
jgi:hypothetical protein